MKTEKEMLSLMDLLDLDEEMIDERLKTIMERNSFTKKHVHNAIQLLQYKQLINEKDGIDCENEEEFHFIIKLINEANTDNIKQVCNILDIVLSLNKSSLVSKCEHLMQQILSNICFHAESSSENSTWDENESTKTLISLKLCEIILDAVSRIGEKISLLFLEIPIENLISAIDEKLRIHFITSTVPKLLEGTVGYNILDRIWSGLIQSMQNNNKEASLKTLSCLSEYYLPIPDDRGRINFESEIITHYEFWDLLLYSLNSSDTSVRKIACYLIKRSIDSVLPNLKRDVIVTSEIETIFVWEQKNEKNLKQTWQNFFILIESLEEKQCNIVLPSLQLFGHLKGIPTCWIDCALNIALKHDNTQIRLKCIEYRLYIPISGYTQAVVLLEAINDMNIFDNPKDYENLKENLTISFEDIQCFFKIFRAIPKIKWSPIPLYYMSDVLSTQKTDINTNNVQEQITETIKGILKIPCNNIAIRMAVIFNMARFIANCCKGLKLNELLQIHSTIKTKSTPEVCLTPYADLVKYIKLTTQEKDEFFQTVATSPTNIQFAILYLCSNPSDFEVFMKAVAEKIMKVKEIVSRQYSDKTEHLKDLIFIMKLFNETANKTDFLKQNINTVIAREHKTIAQYMCSLLESDINVCIDEMRTLFEEFTQINRTFGDIDIKKGEEITPDDLEVLNILVHLYNSAMVILQNTNTDTHIKVFSINVINNVMDNIKFNSYYAIETIRLGQFLNIIKNVKLHETNSESSGRLRNIFYDKSCEIVHKLIKESYHCTNMNNLIVFIDNVIECGGYGCLKWILKIMTLILPPLLNNNEINYNMTQFIHRMWKEIEELKSNKQYAICIEEFVNILTEEALLRNAMYNNVVISYCSKIIELGPVKNTPLFYLVRKLNKMTITSGQMVNILFEILMYTPVPRKDQRIMDNLALEISSMLGLEKTYLDTHFNFEIQYLAISTLAKNASSEVLDFLTVSILTKIEETFENKQRYHGNSQPHKLLLLALQHLLFIGLLDTDCLQKVGTVDWCIDMLQRLPHQPSVRICLEWLISLYFLTTDSRLNDCIHWLESKRIPITSQLMILYWVLKNKIQNGRYTNEEYEFVMDILLSHTMGQTFNVRLYSQYLATKIYALRRTEDKYAYTIIVIEKTFLENSNDKNFVKIKHDVLANEFDIVNNLVPGFIYYYLPRYCDVGCNENVDTAFLKLTFREINDVLLARANNDFKREWINTSIEDVDVFTYKMRPVPETSGISNDLELGTIQKKYIPWKDMTDINVYDQEKKRENPGQMIVVASLIDKLPNLGGMARTSEVFGVKTYVVDSLRHLQDKQFQGLSVSAERWVDVEEVRPGAPLKAYLMQKKVEGYILVAAEQTSTSRPLQTFKFPMKTLLLLGHEKEGIPCDLLPIMDHCVEIPQQGFVRSLNVHVTAAIFIWEYTRQNIL